VYPGLFLRSSTRRAKQSRFRRQRVPVEIEPEESVRDEAADDARDSERIEVHVHVHRGEGSKRSRSKRSAAPPLTGVLFDWQWYRDRLEKRPRQTADGRWARVKRCHSCDTPVARIAQRCPRCAAPLGRSRLRAAAFAFLGLGSIGVVFALCAHLLGGSVPEHQAPAPLGEWSDDGYVIIEASPPAPSPFAPTPPGQSAGNGTATP